MNDLSSVVSKIKQLEKEINRLKRVEMPIVPDVGVWQSWKPDSVVGWSTITSRFYRYCLIGKICYFAVWVTGTSDSTAVSIPLPYNANSISTHFYWNGSAVGQNNGTNLTAPARWGVQSNTAVLTVWRDWAAANWTASGTKTVYAAGFYEVE